MNCPTGDVIILHGGGLAAVVLIAIALIVGCIVMGLK